MAITTADVNNWITDLGSVYKTFQVATSPSATAQPAQPGYLAQPNTAPGNIGGGISTGAIVGGVVLLVVGVVAVKALT